MATQAISRSILRRPAKFLLVRSFASSSPLANSQAASRQASTLLNRSRALIFGLSTVVRAGLISARDLSTQATSSSLKDQSPNWSNPPPKETIMLDGCDFEHWLVIMEKPEGDLSRDEIIDSYIKTLAQVVGSEEEARMKIYSVSHRCYYAFGALISEDVSHKIKELPNVKWVLPDSYLDVNNKDYGGEPFIDGKAVPYDPKYHEEWIRNNAAQRNNKNQRNGRARNSDRSRNFERRRENVRGNQDTGFRGPPPPPNMGQHHRGPPPPPNMGQNHQGPPPPNLNGGYQQQGQGGGMQQQQQPYPPNRDQY